VFCETERRRLRRFFSRDLNVNALSALIRAAAVAAVRLRAAAAAMYGDSTPDYDSRPEYAPSLCCVGTVMADMCSCDLDPAISSPPAISAMSFGDGSRSQPPCRRTPHKTRSVVLIHAVNLTTILYLVHSDGITLQMSMA